jgi:uncharacterized Zn finger protein
MQAFTCVACGSQHVVWLPDSSILASVNYFRCGECGYVWNVPKDYPNDPPNHVTPVQNLMQSSPIGETVSSPHVLDATMLILRCPECGSSNATYFDVLSNDSYFDYYRCLDCEHLCRIVKDPLNANVTNILE